MAKKQISINLEEENIEKLDELCYRLKMNRAQILRLLLSGKKDNIEFVCENLIKMEEELY